MASASWGEGDGEGEAISAINVTPLVDIFLVLLIIFLVASTLLETREIAVNLPKAAHAGSASPKAFGLSMDIERRLYLDGLPIDSTALMLALREAVQRDSAHQVLISADEALAYRDIVGLIDQIRGAGVSKYALKVTRQP